MTSVADLVDPVRIEQRRVPIDTLEPWPGNARKGNLELIKRSLTRFGQYRSISVQTTTMRIMAGNNTWQAARELGWSEISIELCDVDDATALEINVLDNRANDVAEYDLRAQLEQLEHVERLADLTRVGYTPEDLDRLRERLGELERPAKRRQTDPDDVPAAPEQPITKRGDVWQLGRHRLICGDSTTAEPYRRLLGKQRPGMCFTSFPYAVDLDYGDTYDDTIGNLRRLLDKVPARLASNMAAGAYVVTNFCDVVAGRSIVDETEPCEYPAGLEYWPAFRSAGFVLHTRRIWAKPHARVSAPWTSNSNRAAADWEHVWTWKLPGPALNERRDPSYRGVWSTAELPALDVGKSIHPAAFPVGLVETALEIYTDAGALVLEPFSGTGTTLIAAEHTDRIGMAIEISPHYVDIACRRFQEHTGIIPVRDGTEVDFAERGAAA